jgi:hypothetical protein
MSDRLSDNQWSIICTLKQHPDYVFLGSEGRSAERMVERGFLHRSAKKKGCYSITVKGYQWFYRGLG